MKKISLIALAVPALFAACSQEDIVSDVQNQSGEMLGKVAGDVTFVFDNTPETRMTWAATGDAGLQWNTKDDGDAFSLFWLGTNPGESAYKGVTNALYKSTNGSEFKSENIIYEGNHIIVYPADYAHFTEKEIVVSVPEPQNAADDLGTKRTVVVSDLLTIKGPFVPSYDGEEPDENIIYAGGYNASLNHGSAAVGALSSHMVLNLNFDLKKLTEVEVRSVKLVANKDVFATAGNLVNNTDGFISLSPTETTNSVTLNANAAVVNTENKSYMAQISLLPPVLSNVDANYSIVVETNYGLITIDKALDVTNNSQKPQFKPFEVEDEDGNKVAGEADEKTPLSFYTEFVNIATRDLDTDTKTEGNQSEGSYGQRIIRNVNVDMSKASIENWPVKTSADLIAAYAIYDNLERGASEETQEETFVLEGVARDWNGDGTVKSTKFELTPEAYDEILEHPYVTLSNGDKLNHLYLKTGNNTKFTAAPNLSVMTGRSSLKAYMNSGNVWNLNIYDAANVMCFAAFENKGEVTLTATQNTKENSNEANLDDDLVSFKSTGKTIFDHSVTDKVNYTLSGTTEVASDKSITLAGTDNSIGGILNVNGELIVSGGNTTLTGTTNVYGSLLSTTNAELENDGTIWIKQADASLIISKQTETAVIELEGRHNNVRVSDNKAQGYIKWTCDATTLTKDATDAFNYVRLGSNIQWMQDEAIDYIEITGNKVQITGQVTDVKKVIVNNGKTLVVPNGSSITADEVGGNRGGKVQVYGAFNHGTSETNGTHNGVTIYDFNETTPD